jgi:predicted TIM-barrel fold metal-dependent hydrolase
MKIKAYEKWDVHHHAVPEFMVEELGKIGLKRVVGLNYPKWNPDLSLKMMEELNISKTFLSIPSISYFRDNDYSRSLTRRCNEYLAKLIKEYPGKFGGFAAIPLPDVEGAMNELKYSLDVLKLDGINLSSSVNGKYLGSKEYRTFFAELNERNATVFIHPNFSVEREDEKMLSVFYWWHNDTTLTLIDFIRSGYHKDYPNIKFIPAHGGGILTAIHPELLEGLKAENSNIEMEFEIWKSQLFLDTAKTAYDEPLSSLFEFTDSNHIVFGSDFPWAKRMDVNLWVNLINSLETKKKLSNVRMLNIYMGNAKNATSLDRVPISEKSLKKEKHENIAKNKKIKYHYHCLPNKVMGKIKDIDASFMYNENDIWDDKKAIDFLEENHYEKLMLSLDIPQLWHHNSYDISNVLRAFNNEAASIRSKNPKIFGVFGAVNIEHPLYALGDIEYCLDELKLDGLCLYTDVASKNINHLLDKRVLEKLSSVSVPILIHPKNATGIPVVNENYLDSVFFISKAFYLGVYEKYFTNSKLVLTHTSGMIPYIAYSIGVLYYFRLDKWKMVKFLVDYMIKKKNVGYDILKNVVVD